MDRASKQCARCGEVKPLDDFSPHPHAKDGFNSECKLCRQARRFAGGAQASASVAAEPQPPCEHKTRLCSDEYIEKVLPGFFLKRERTKPGWELQVCVECRDEKLVQLYDANDGVEKVLAAARLEDAPERPFRSNGQHGVGALAKGWEEMVATSEASIGVLTVPSAPVIPDYEAQLAQKDCEIAELWGMVKELSLTLERTRKHYRLMEVRQEISTLQSLERALQAEIEDIAGAQAGDRPATAEV
jgi:hypothetical protein